MGGNFGKFQENPTGGACFFSNFEYYKCITMEDKRMASSLIGNEVPLSGVASSSLVSSASRLELISRLFLWRLSGIGGSAVEEVTFVQES